MSIYVTYTIQYVRVKSVMPWRSFQIRTHNNFFNLNEFDFCKSSCSSNHVMPNERTTRRQPQSNRTKTVTNSGQAKREKRHEINKCHSVDDECEFSHTIQFHCEWNEACVCVCSACPTLRTVNVFYYTNSVSLLFDLIQEHINSRCWKRMRETESQSTVDGHCASDRSQK